LMRLFFHEAMRSYADRILMKHDLNWFIETLTKICKENFEQDNEETLPNENKSGQGTPKSNKLNAQYSGAKNIKYPSVRTSREKNSDEMTHQVETPKKQSKASWEKIDLNIRDPQSLWFSILNEEVEGCYQEVTNTDNITGLIEAWVDRFNESNDRKKISLILYSEFNRHLLKILRNINMHDGHLIIVGLRGYGITLLTKLACFISGI